MSHDRDERHFTPVAPPDRERPKNNVINGAELSVLAKKITSGSHICIDKRVEEAFCHCPTCGRLTHGYRRHTRNVLPWVHCSEEDVCHDFSPIVLPEEETSYEKFQTDYFGMDAKLMSGFCPNCSSHLGQIWYYRFLNFPKPNLRRGHTFGKESLYALDPARFVKEYKKCELRLVELDGDVIGVALCYFDALVNHKAFHGWPKWDFRSNIVCIYIDELLTNKNFSKTPAMFDILHNHPENPKLERDWENAEVLVRELNREAQEFYSSFPPP